MLSATCCMTTLVSFPSKHIRVEHSLLVTDERRLRTVNAHGDHVVDGLYSVINTGNSTLNAGHSFVDMGHPIVDTSHSLVNVSHPVVHANNSIIDRMRRLQNLCSYHPNLFICQFV